MDNPSKHNVYNIQEIRTSAQKSLMDGAVTQDYPLDREEACRLLNEALATEIMCVLRYRHHQVIANGIHKPQVAAEFLEHALNEEQHMMMIAERISQLGGNPDFNPATVAERTATYFGQSDNLIQMIKEDLVAERIAIMVYRKMIVWFGVQDPTTRRMLESILGDEEEHADDLCDLLTIGDH